MYSASGHPRWIYIFICKYVARVYTCFQDTFINTIAHFHRVWQLFNEYVRLILTLYKPDAQESNLSRAKLKSVPLLIRYVNTCKRMDAMCLTLPRTFSVRISERLSAHLPFWNSSISDINSIEITVSNYTKFNSANYRVYMS